MYWMKNQSRQENIIYLAVWGVLFADPLLRLYVRMASDSNYMFNWTEVLMVWRQFGVYLLLFLVHDIFLAPLLIHEHRRTLYFSIVTAIVAAFVIYQCNSRPDFMQRPHPHFDHEPPPFERPLSHEPPRHAPDEHRPPLIIGEHDIVAIVVLLLMFGANLGIKGYFRSRKDRERLALMEKQNREQQLEYLKYQINPHFFMNTLNNIHALVDIEPEKAKDTILELSKMMRFILYEGDKGGVSLSREFDFIRHYVALMKLRYTDKVKITVDLPQEAPDKQIPPLMLITFIENAFKHGISYQQASFIEVKVDVGDDTLRFSCRNSKAEKPNEEKGGVGLANVRKRLNLLYGRNYALSIHNDADVYTVELNIPLL